MEKDIGFSIVIPCYNVENCIDRCMNSIINTRYSNCEIICINDCSTDNTLKKLHEYEERYSNLILINNINNMGAGESRNRGIDISTKEYITFLDADDEITSDFFNKLNVCIKTNNCDCVIFDAINKKKGREIPISMFHTKKYEMGVVRIKDALVYVKGCTWGKVYRSKIIKDNKIRYASLKRNEDLVFTKVAVARMESVYYYKKPLYRYIDNEESLMHNNELLDLSNAFSAYSMIERQIPEYQDELHSIYLIEIIYATCLSAIKKKIDCRRHLKEITQDFKIKDKYFRNYSLKYKVVLLLLRLHLFGCIKFLLRIA